ncbi:Jerky protein-like-like [Holothuria leucospilota]|uniref:Jerky protein-like-like n=1 Tax=Holothuria leucospilota TaxID=206669 RepID=A0A9Q1CK55_HOLLE|nr:Jerky protein-like-like [Holothuria leucospilota]
MLRAKPPKKRGHYRAYPEGTLLECIKKIQQGELGVKAASREYSIPKTTLLDKLSGRRPIISTQGPPPVLSSEEELKLVRWILHMSKIGYGQTRHELCATVKAILDDDRRPNPFKNNLPGPHWVRAFLRRHPEVSERTGEALGMERAVVTPEKVDNWFDEFHSYMTETDEVEEGAEILNDPTRIFNCDESGFPLAGKAEKVLAPKGAKYVYQFSNSDRRQITVMACMNASGSYVEPMLVFPNTRFRYDPLEGAPDDWCVGRSPNGWMNASVFYEWVANHFHPFLQKENIKLPVVLLLDGHSSHLSLEVTSFCAENGIILFCLPAHCSHVLQPCDLSLFKALKQSWKTEVRRWKALHIGQVVTKANFASVFAPVWRAASKPQTAQNGFRAAGLYPFNKAACDRGKLYPSTLFSQPEAGGSSSPAQQPEPDSQESRPSSAPSEAQIAFKHLDASLSDEKRWLFNRRWSEGYNIETDELYNIWRGLRSKQTVSTDTHPTSQRQQDDTHGDDDRTRLQQDDTGVDEYRTRRQHDGDVTQVQRPSSSDFFAKHLRFPTTQERPKRPNRLGEALPHAVSGRVFRSYLQRKRDEKEEDENRKRVNKEKREEARKRKAADQNKKGRKDKRTRSESINEDECAKCKASYDDKEEDWIGCECGRWFHKTCTDIMDAAALSNSEIEGLEWQCEECL